MVHKRARALANVRILGTLLLFLLLGYVTYEGRVDLPGTWNARHIVIIAGILLATFVLTLRPDYMLALVLSLLSAGVGIYLVEVLLSCCVPTSDPIELRVRRAQAAGIPFDMRTKYEVYKDLVQEGVRAYPTVNISNLVDADWLTVKGNIQLPLAGISATMTVLCNESGQYATYTADEHGFNNPAGLFGEERVDVVLVGDSFTHGNCVPEGEDVASHLRITREATLNLGYSGNGPLTELATLKEFAEPLQPAVVLWMYYEGNDLSDLQSREQATLLQDYLEGNFSQNLIARQAEVDKALIHYVEMRAKQIADNDTEATQGGLGTKIARAVRLTRSREFIRMLRPPEEPAPSPLLEEVLLAARDLTASWNGTMYFVYLPSWRRYATEADSDGLFHRARVLSVVEQLNIPVIDVHHTFLQHPDPLSLFPFRIEGHYTSEGYELVASSIETYLQSRSGNDDSNHP